MNVGTVVRVKDHVWYDTYAQVIRIENDIAVVKILMRIHKSTGNLGRVGSNEVWKRKTSQLEMVHNHARP